MKRLFLSCVAGWVLLLTGCASTLHSDVTSFQRWPANAASSTYSFQRTAAQDGSLEHHAYEDLARLELTQLGLKEAVAGAKGRFEVALGYGVSTRTVTSTEPVWNSFGGWYDPYFYPGWGGWPGWSSNWGPYPYYTSPYGPSVVGYRTVSRDVSTHRLRVEISEGPNKVFDTSATSSGSNATLSLSMPYLMRSVFDGFPGTNGQTREIEFNMDKGVVTNRRIKQPN